MSAKKELPPYIVEELGKYGLAILETGKNGVGHPYVAFRDPRGGIRKWCWPRIGHCDPRAMKNNRSQLRNYLRYLHDQARSLHPAV